MSRYLRFELALNKPKTSVWNVVSKGHHTLLGQIKWFGRWRQYCFYPENAIFNSECLSDIKDFLEEQMNLRKKT